MLKWLEETRFSKNLKEVQRSSSFFLIIAFCFPTPAKPEVLLSPQRLQVVAEGEKTLSCHVHNFYPQAINISWLLRKPSSVHEIPLSSDICTGVPSLSSQNGLFSVLSRVTHVMNETNNGSLYICRVQHESLAQPLQRNTTLFVTSKRPHICCFKVILACVLA